MCVRMCVHVHVQHAQVCAHEQVSMEAKRVLNPWSRTCRLL